MQHAHNVRQFEKQWPKFAEWLIARGSAIYTPTNPYEVARFLTDSGIGVVYRDARHNITSMQNGAHEAYRAFLSSGEWRAVHKVKRKRGDRDFPALIKRDGNACLYCMTTLNDENYTIEHLIPIASGGTNHLANKALACAACNRDAGHLSVKEKIELAISRRPR